jgi:hypothetical protein
MRKVPILTVALLVLLVTMTTYLVMVDERIPTSDGERASPVRPVGWNHVYLRVL